MEGVRSGGGDAPLTPRESTLLRAVQRGDYGVLAHLLRISNGCEKAENSALEYAMLYPRYYVGAYDASH